MNGDKMKVQHIDLFEVREDVVCNKCGNRGAVRAYGGYFPHGMHEEFKDFFHDSYIKDEYQKVAPRMFSISGLGGTVPWRCLNCGNSGLTNFVGLEGYKCAFTKIETK